MFYKKNNLRGGVGGIIPLLRVGPYFHRLAHMPGLFF